MANEFGKKLKNYREATFPDMGLRHVAKEIGIDYSYLYRIEGGMYTPSDEMLIKIMEAYQLPDREKLDLFEMIHDAHYRIIQAVRDEDPKNFHKVFAFNRKKKN